MAGQMGWLHVGYSPVWVFLSRAQLFCNEWPGYAVLFLAELGYRTCRCLIHTNCTYMYKDRHIVSSSNPLQGLIL